MVLAGVIAAATLLAGSFILVMVKDRTYYHSPDYQKEQDAASRALVVYYSRSGHTEGMTRKPITRTAMPNWERSGTCRK